ncbi:hypothetical protein [Pedobacter montanisoli]|uniref:Phosphoribosylpyrophosphate synthetase n=1 Tax=Pedobacter montanisoli TaxID=2923277 RepID=A0ABS9ZTB7_9SPHI|nr:hypothetical protein [Pedobacter montanisoli]MCJ0741568.1 hypothetical protein [Pedobacter montanisoli]
MKQPNEMNTLSQVMEKLRQRGITNEITVSENNEMRSEEHNKTYAPEDLTIIKTYRFEGMSDPADNVVLYLIEDSDAKLGFILDAYGAYSNNKGTFFDDFLKQIAVQDRDEQELFNS